MMSRFQLKNTCFVLMALLCSGGVLTAQGQPARPINIDLGHSTFAYDESQSLVEVYLAFEGSSLDFERETSSFHARLPLNLALVRSTDAALEGTPSDPVWQDATMLNFVVPDTSMLDRGQFFVHQVRALLQPGDYELHVEIPADAERGRPMLAFRQDVLVADFATEDLVGLSDVTLATAIQASEDREDPFYKNGLTVRPNANQLFGQGLPRLFYYAEAYNTNLLAGADGSYTALVYVAEANRPQPLAGMQKRLDREARSPDVIVGSFDLSEVPSGSYFLRIALLNEDNEALAEQSRKFFVYNPGVIQEEAAPVVAVTFETSPYAVMAQEDVERELDYAALVANDQERRRMRGIRDLDEQRRFLMDFWQKRDPQPATAINEYKDDFIQRVQYANERYSSSLQEGWKSDRGRVLIKYGMPTAIEPHLYERDQMPHEIWQFNNIPGEGQAIFVFADRNGFGQFELIHSSVAGERSLADWQSELRR